MRPFLVCIHDATPAYARETEAIVRDLAPLVGRRLSFAVVPNWHGRWPLAEHPEYCAQLSEGADELLLHGYFHRRQRGWGPVTLVAEHSDEMNGLDAKEALAMIARGQDDFMHAFGRRARGFLAPTWQRGAVRLGDVPGLDYILGFFGAQSRSGTSVPLATFTWDCGPRGWLGHVGHAIGTLMHLSDRRVPSLAIHPRDLARGYWPKIMRLTETLINTGYVPTTVDGLLRL